MNFQNNIKPNCGEFTFLGISGCSGSGKTTISIEIKKRLGEKFVEVISFDNYYRSLNYNYEKLQSEINFDNPSLLDDSLLVEHLNELKNNRNIYSPVYNFKKHTREINGTKITPKKLIIVEGFCLYCFKKIVDFLDFKVFVDIDLDIALSRRIVRDVMERGRSWDDVLRQYVHHVRPCYLRHIKPSQEFADLIVDGEVDLSQNIENIMRLISNHGQI